MAWLHAVPEPPEGSKRAKAADKPPQLSRRDQMKKDKIPIEMPPNPMPHVVARLIEIGISEPAGMGVGPLSWLSIDAWQRTTGITLDPWEVQLLRALSLAYVSESQKAESENCPPPFKTAVSRREIEIERNQLAMVLG